MRLLGLDVLRGYAIVLMVIFHFSFDLNNFHILTLDLKHGEFWKYFRFLIVTIFVFSSGMSLKLAHQDSLNITKLKKRVLILTLASLLVSIGSYTQFPDSWIYFGILHFFLFATVVGVFFLKIPKIAFLIALLILFGYYFDFLNMHWFFSFVQKPLHLPAFYTEDLATIFPWFGVFLLGIVSANYGIHTSFLSLPFFNTPLRFNNSLAFLGRHSLLIYLLHQPFLFTIFTFLRH